MADEESDTAEGDQEQEGITFFMDNNDTASVVS
jgi:hypothetical protein